MGMQVLPPLPDRFLDDARAGYHAPQEAGHQNVIMLKQYTVIGLLGRGSFGHVVKALDPSGQEVAIKLLPRGERIRGHRANVKREIVHQGSLKHPFIVGLKEVFLTHAHLAIVMECAQGGDLFKFLMGQPGNRLPEEEARRIFQQLIIGLDYCHCQGVANRDLKLENLLLSQDCSNGKRPLLKICDFGFSKHEANSGTAKTSVGTPIYMAPEIIYGSNRYDAKKADIWSCGVILYTLIYGCYPFNKEEKHYANKIVGAVYRLHPDVPASNGCLHLLRQLLVADPAERLPLAGIKQQPWFLEDLPEGALAMNDVFLMDHNKPKLEHPDRNEATEGVFMIRVHPAPGMPSEPQTDEDKAQLPGPELYLKHYKQVAVLGTGTFGTVLRAVDTSVPAGQRRQRKEVAIKLLPRGEFVKNFRTYVKREIQHQSSLRHPFIIGLMEVFLTPTHLGIAMEFAQGGDLFQYLLRQQPHCRLLEVHARWIFQQLMIGLDFCHRKGVANRDLKLENLLLDRDGKDGSRPLLKICDFGYSKHETNSTAKTGVGTPIYMAPEIIYGGNRYDAKKADIWSSGVILYALLYGRYPFNAKEKDYAKNIVTANYAMPEDVQVSTSCKELLSHVLVADPAQRMSMADIKQHPWFQHHLPEGALAMNDWYLTKQPNAEQHMQSVDRIIEQASHTAQEGEELPTVRLTSD